MMVAQHYECSSYHWTVHLKMVTMVNFIFTCILPFKKKNWRERKESPLLARVPAGLHPAFLQSPRSSPHPSSGPILFSSLLPDAVAWAASIHGAHSLVDWFVHSPSTSPGPPFSHGLMEGADDTTGWSSVTGPDGKSPVTWARQGPWGGVTGAG